MAREQFQTLTEPMYYILLSLLSEVCGVDIMDRVHELSRGRVSVGPGTLYTLLDKFVKVGMIEETKMLGRKKHYVVTKEGVQALKTEQERLCILLEDGQILKDYQGEAMAERESV